MKGAYKIELIKYWKLYNNIKEKESELFQKAIKKTKLKEYKDDFWYADISLEIFDNGEGHIVYLLFMVGTLIIEFAEDGSFEDAYLVGG